MKNLLKKQKNPTITPFLIVAVTVRSVFGNESILFAVSRNLNPKKILEKLIINHHEILDPQQICDEMNCYFSKVGENLAKNLLRSDISFMHYLKLPVRDGMFLNDVTRGEIIKEISRLAPRKAAGPDSIGPSLVKKFSHLFVGHWRIFTTDLC